MGMKEYHTFRFYLLLIIQRATGDNLSSLTCKKDEILLRWQWNIIDKWKQLLSLKSREINFERKLAVERQIILLAFKTKFMLKIFKPD